MNLLLDIKLVQEVIESVPFVKNIVQIEKDELTISGSCIIFFDGLDKELLFKFEIYPPYPLKYHNSESITFYNDELVELNHVMENGSICIHNLHCNDWKKKLVYDFLSLKQWIEKYYINKYNDTKYEHIIVEEHNIDSISYSYLFTEIDYKFATGDFGLVNISLLHNSYYKEQKIKNYIVQNFILEEFKFQCKWNSYYKNFTSSEIGIYYFLGQAPANYNKFIFKNWEDFQGLLSNDFLNSLHDFDRKNLKKQKGHLLPIFIGYKTLDNNIHWQVALVKIGELPIKGEKRNFLGNNVWQTKLVNSEINWALTRDSSYKYFFGRGTLTNNITDKKILIIGIGAIGSMIAKTLTKCGCKYIDIADYDIKEPENVCRSEYMFEYGITDKTTELYHILCKISPFVEITILKNEYFELISKIHYKDNKSRQLLEQSINEYDIVFDCTTDNDLMYILNSLNLTSDVINMSITNHAKELVCGFYPNIYNFVLKQYETILNNDINNLYEPLGCWSPTFKASYNDIDLLVQFAIKHINQIYKNNLQPNNFIVQMNEKNLNLEIKEY